jgi:hypothetical protein
MASSASGGSRTVGRRRSHCAVLNCARCASCAATGHALANKGTDTRTLQHYLGHRSIGHTVRYSELAADRFVRLWSD